MSGNDGVYQMVMERYVGKQPNVIKAENELEKLRVRIVERHFSILNKKVKGDISAEEINKSEENRNIENYLKSMFNVKEMSVVWIYTSIPNAFTPVKSFPMLDKNYGIDSKGIDYNKKLTVTVFVHTGLFTHIDLTSDECMAIILHEIGHNFYQSLFHALTKVNPYTILMPSVLDGSLPMYQGVLNALTLMSFDLIKISELFKTFFTLKDNVIDKLGIRKLWNAYGELGVMIGYLSPAALRTFIGLLEGKLYVPWHVFDPFDIAFTYSVEKHADSFAVDYGYAKSLASGLNKMDQRVNSFKYDVPVVGWIYDMEALINDIFFQTFSGYPTMHNRQQSALKRLKESSKDPNIPKDIRTRLENDIKEFEEYYDRYMSMENDENKKRIFTWIYRRGIVDGMFKGNLDLREIFYKLDKTHASKDTWEAGKEFTKKAER